MKKSKILDEMHSTMRDLHSSNLVNKKTMRNFDMLCLKTVHDMTPTQIKHLREKEHISQSIFAAYLNASVSSIKKWETGEKRPSGIALKLLNIIEKKGLAVIS